MSDRPIPVNCPCCQAPLPPPQDEFQITCNHCGAQLVLKLPIDHRIEKLAFEECLLPSFSVWGAFIMSLGAGFFYGWPIWRFWLRDSGYHPLVQCVILSIVFLVMFVLLIICKIIIAQMRKCAEQCEWSVAKLRALVKVQPNKIRTNLLPRVESNIEKIKRQFDM